MSLADDRPYQSYPPSLWDPVPAVLATLDPSSIVAGAMQVVTITGTGFTSRSRIWADEEQQITTYVSSTSLTYEAQADEAGAQDVTVHNGDAVSNSLPLTVTAEEVEDPRASASPGDSFSPEGSIIGSTSTQAAKLSGLGYAADPHEAWGSGDSITVNGYLFHWDGSAWAPGVAP